MADAFLSLPVEDRREALRVATDRSGRPAHFLEKDVWVVWALATLFGSDIGAHLVFKGGTSLSKAYSVIRRFSEDVDLTYDIRAIAPDLVAEDGEALPKNRSEEKRWSKTVRHRLPEWIAETVQPLVASASDAQSLAATLRAEGDRLYIDYEATSAGSGYVAPSVMLELGARSTGEPASLRDVTCDAAGLIDGVDFPLARPRVMHAERTFWEKATAIHVFCLQERLRGERFARHWHDVVRLDEAEIAAAALADRQLGGAVARHKSMFFAESRRVAVALYDEIAKLRPEWAEGGRMNVVMTGNASDPAEFKPHIRKKSENKKLANRFKDPADPFNLVIVRDMWLTGFDAPCLHTLYVDKPMRGHGLMQAIARVNRVFGEKPGGLIVD